MRLLASILMCFAMTGAFAKNPVHRIFGEYSSVILKASSVKVFRVQQFPVVSTEQLPNGYYVFDYEVTHAYNYENNKRFDSLNAALMDTTQFLYEDKRTCPFVGKYAVEFTKGKRKITLVFSEEPCFKMIVFCPGTEIDKKHLDLREDNNVYAALKMVASDKL